jgi:hypothetical protein
VGPYCSYALSVIQNFKNQTGFCSKCHCFEEASEHWTLLYMTISTLHMWRYNSVIDSFLLQQPQVGPYWSYAFSVIQNFKNQIGFCSKCHCFEGSNAHWTVLYITTSTLNSFCYNSVNDSFCSKSLKWDHTVVMLFQLFKISKIKLDFAQYVTFFAGSSAHLTLLYLTISSPSSIRFRRFDSTAREEEPFFFPGFSI